MAPRLILNILSFLLVIISLFSLSRSSTEQMAFRVISGTAAEASRIATTLTCDQERSDIQICSQECLEVTENETGCPGFYAEKNEHGPCYMCRISDLSEVQNSHYTTFTSNHFLYLRAHNKTEPEVSMDFEDFSPDGNSIHGNNVDGTTSGITVSDHVTGVRGKGVYFNNGAKITLTGSENECWTNIEHCSEGLTLSIWVKLEEITITYVVGSGAIKQRGVNIFLQNQFSMMTTLDDRRFYAWSTTNPVINTWYLVTGTYEPMNGNSVYINGILEAENKFDSAAYHQVDQVDWRAHIGVRDSIPVTDPMTGTVDEFKYFYKILNMMGLYP